MSSVISRGSITGKVEDKGSIKGKVGSSGNVRGEVNQSQRDYNMLRNKPSINGTELVGNYDEIDPTVPEWSKSPSKPSYSYDETGAVGGENEISSDRIDRMFAAVFGI